MNCWEYRDFSAHPTGQGPKAWPTATAAAAAAHLARCCACREFAEQWTAVGPVLERWNAPAPEPLASARAELAARLAAPRPRPAARPGWRAAGRLLLDPARRLLPGAVGVAAVLAMGVLAWHGRGPTRDTGWNANRLAMISPPNTTPAPPLTVPYAGDAPSRSNLRAQPRPGGRGGEAGHARARSDRSDQSDRPDRSEHEHEYEHARGPLAPHGRPASGVDDLASINTDPEATLRQWAAVPPAAWEQIEARVHRTVRVRDDFVQIPFPRIASTSERQIAGAVEQYKKEAAIVDPRLSREVTLAVKAMAFSDLCERLRADTGIEVSAGPSVADEKVTLFCEKRPLREIMREITHVFGFTWLRSRSVFGVGSSVSGADADPNTEHRTPNTEYRYELDQDLRSQLAEEELRNRDLNAAFLALDEKMAAYRPYLDLSPEQLKTRLEQAKEPEKELLSQLAGRSWGPIQTYFRLTPAQRSALINGEPLRFSSDPGSGDRQLPAAWRQRLLQTAGLALGSLGGKPVIVPQGMFGTDTPLADVPEPVALVTLSVSRSELGQVTLNMAVGGYPENAPDQESNYGAGAVTAQSPSTAKPDNEGANHALGQQPFFERAVTIQPISSCPWFAPNAPRRPADKDVGVGADREGRRLHLDPEGRVTAGPDPPHVFSGDIWEAVHRATGVCVVADAYTHFYPLSGLTFEHTSLFDLLCRAGERLGVRWRMDGGWLLCRRSSYFWDQLKEVPNRLLRRWQEEHKKNGYLPLDDLLEMTSLSDQQLDSIVVGNAIRHCWDLEEWAIVGSGGFHLGLPGGFYYRSVARFLASLTPEQRRLALQPEGLAVETLARSQQESLARTLAGESNAPPPEQAGLRLHFTYVPIASGAAGPYLWFPVVSTAGESDKARQWPVVLGKTREATLASARRFDPGAEPDQVRPSQGVLALRVTRPDGSVWQKGGPAVGIRTNP